ncbi:Polyketide synthase-nonribosomal peptide synthetase ACE1 [Paramyrothecium foliicola]|nr:Polyketide synthase-nonribosomal peptide synthetase ACE1 [Paramyrothecium foliicola]
MVKIPHNEPIAIIGSGCRFPGDATSPSKLWELLLNPRQVGSAPPADRFSLQGFYHESGQYHGHMNVKQAYFLEGKNVHKHFDAPFFGFSAGEVSSMDPQCRLLLETVYEALEEGGITIESLRGSDTAVYAGQMIADYDYITTRDLYDSMGIYHAPGTSRAMLSNRISYFFDWHGPSMTIDTACSSSLIALHQAVQQLRTGQSRVAVAAGANLLMDAQYFVCLSSMNMLSPEGRSRMWDAGADGYARGEGIAAVVLKSLSAALEDGDHIDCIIRETACGQDGKTKGITSPNHLAQAQMIRDCYARAGLDLNNPADRPQFFECHGTGTLAGDAAESEAIFQALFANRSNEVTKSGPLMVGSIKSLVGHTEGAAGLAGILKASLAIQNATIPPNLLFNNLNPQIKPFYDNVELVTSATAWPEVGGGVARRASVNSFGFGGAIAHAILESYEPLIPAYKTIVTNFAPFVFSAASEASLASYLVSFREYLTTAATPLNLRDVAWTLHCRRTAFAVTTVIVASTVDDLIANIDAKIEATKQDDSGKPALTRVAGPSAAGDGAPRILGIFTGQGAQWASMGSQLILSSNVARETCAKLEARLARLPDRPEWSLTEELLKDSSKSRIAEALLSQPLCTAIQILQVDVLRAAGIKFSAVAGHSSGEIAAAYAAGFLNGEDAICIAYYRGVHSKHARGADGQAGAMLAVGTSYEDAYELCEDTDLKGRVCVAAVNSPMSVTLSGDADAVEEVKAVLDDEKKFTRMLKVDKAYHSHHITPCSAPYLASLAQLDVEVRPGDQATWFSSVIDGQNMATKGNSLKGPYWDQNMLSPVLFQQAVAKAYETMGPFDLAIEVGPHPALKGPTLQTMQEVTTQELPYTALFQRGVSTIESVAEGLGYIWSCFGSNVIDLDKYDKFLSGNAACKLVKGLPSYSWSNEEYWNESRYGRAVRTRAEPAHQLLGHSLPDSTEHDMRWRNILRPSEIPWLLGHLLQDQIVFPAAGYMVSAMEAARVVCRQRGLSMDRIEIADAEFDKAMVFENENTDIEVVISLSDIRRKGDSLLANYKYHAADNRGDGALSLSAEAIVRIYLGEPSIEALPERPPNPANLVKVRTDEFMAAFKEIGYQWAGLFATIDDLYRKQGAAIGSIGILDPTELLIHPAYLDAAFQGVLLSLSYPEDNQLWTLHVPRRIKCLTINPYLCERQARKTDSLPIAASCHPDTNRKVGNVDIYTTESNVSNSMIQVEGLECVPISRASPNDDKEEFATVVWDVANADASDVTITEVSSDMINCLEKLAAVYLQKLDEGIPPDHPARSGFSHGNLLRAASKAGASLSDLTYDQAISACQAHSQSPELQLLQSVGGQIVTAVSEGATVTVEDALAQKYWEDSISMSPYLKGIAKLVEQLSHRYPQLNILGSGYGVARVAKMVLRSIQSVFASYTLAGAEQDFPTKTKTLFKEQKQNLEFKTLNMDQSVRDQGFKEESQVSRSELTLGAFEGWWSRKIPAITLVDWDRLLLDAGFSGCDSTTLESNTSSSRERPAIFISQAMDSKLQFLRQPLSSAVSSQLFPNGKPIQDLIILGGTKLSTARAVDQVKNLLQLHCEKVRVVRTLVETTSLELSTSTTILSLLQLDDALFPTINEEQWDALKNMVMNCGTMLWVTQGRRADNPFASMAAGLMRSIVREVMTLNYQMVDFEDAGSMNAYTLAEATLRFHAESLWARQDSLHTTVETDLVIDESGRALIPRLKANKAMNDRYNAIKRTVTTHQSPGSQSVAVVKADSPSGYALRETPMAATVASAETLVLVVTHASISALPIVGFGRMFIVLGNDEGSKKQYLALTLNNTSIVKPLKTFCMEINGNSLSHPKKVLSSIFLELLAESTLKGVVSGDTIAVFEPTTEIASAILKHANESDVKVTFITTSNTASTAAQNGKWVSIHRSIPRRALSRLLPQALTAFIDFSVTSDAMSARDQILKVLPSQCRVESVNQLLSHDAWTFAGTEDQSLSQLLQFTESSIASIIETAASELPVFQAETVAKAISPIAPWSLVEWSPATTIPVEVQPIDTHVTFAPNKTYWLAGLSRTLGLAICEWMIRHGARHVAISSRSPNIDPAWLEDMRQLGVNIFIGSCDVTSKEEVHTLYREICANMPPIAGVAQGSMVLDDTAIRDMTLENLLRGTKPKVEGSLHLNDLFQHPTLDFFVFFSSMVAIIGQPGQANYSASNLFMASLAQQRRKKGLAGSVIHIGPVYGAGYAVQINREVFTRAAFRSTGLSPVSERDVYLLFAEAVAAGRPNSGAETIDISNAARIITRGGPDRPVWETEPMMSHFVRNSGDVSSGSGDGANKLSLKAQLQQATEKVKVNSIIHEALLPKLYGFFQLDPAKVSTERLGKMRLDEMGIDSLIAVEIRGWFMKTIEVNIPVLKILSGVPISDLIDAATNTIPERLIPNIKSKSSNVDSDGHSSYDQSTSNSNSDSLSSSGVAEINSSSISDLESVKDLPNTVREPTVQKTSQLSFGQEMFHFVWKYLEDKTTLNNTFWARLTGKVRIHDMHSAAKAIFASHDVFRTRIVDNNDQPVQQVMDEPVISLEVKPISGEAEVLQIYKHLQEEHVYDISAGKMCCLMLLSASPVEHYLVGGLHHLLLDGISFQVLLKRLHAVYNEPEKAFLQHSWQFSDYLERQHQDYASGKLELELSYWKKQLSTTTPPLPILTISRAARRPELKSYDNLRSTIMISAATKLEIQDLCRKSRVTPFHFYVSVFRALLARLTPEGEGEDVIIGISDANRTEDAMGDAIGPLVNLLPIRLLTSDSLLFKDLLHQTRDQTYAALEHSKLPFQLLLKELNVSRSSSYPSLFQTFVNYHQGLAKATQWDAKDDEVLMHEPILTTSRVAYDVSLDIVDYADGGCAHSLVVRKDLYSHDELGILIACYERLIHAFAIHPSATLVNPDIFEAAEIERATEFSRGPVMVSHWPATVVHRFEEQVDIQPGAPAVKYDGVSLSYAEINHQAHCIAANLSGAGLTIGSCIATYIEPGPAWVSSLLGIMRAGCTYVPLDTSLPLHRIASILEDCCPSLILADHQGQQRLEGLSNRRTRSILVAQAIKENDKFHPNYAVADGIAVVLYTSGSSGTPKGVGLRHEGLRNWFEVYSQKHVNAPEAVLQQTSPSFDLCLAQTFIALCFGGTLCIVPRHLRYDPAAITQIVTEGQVTTTVATPTEYLNWIQYSRGSLSLCNSWTTALSGGEAVPLSLIEGLASLNIPSLEFFNTYGPSEATISATEMPVSLTHANTPVPAGQPLPNYSVFVLDPQQRPVPIGIQGEIYLGGVAISSGYINRPELTGHKFIPDPWMSPEFKAQGWRTLHRTGDLGRWQQDGTLLIEGRNDTQVKLRGLRIDLAEVEQMILSLSKDSINEAIVSIRHDLPDRTELMVAHIVLTIPSHRERVIADIRKNLSKKLPQYMCPGDFVCVDRLPTTISGKIDRRKIATLPLPAMLEQGQQSAHGLTDTEARLRDVWSQVIPLPQAVTSTTDFFHIGGSSVLLLLLRTRIKESFNIDIPVVQMFEISTLALMARHIDSGGNSDFEATKIDWDNEVSVPSQLANMTLESVRLQSDQGQVVVLTGATGRLGRTILKELISSKNITHVHCIGVRKAHMRPDFRSIDSKRVTVYDGDLISPRLGLSDAGAAQIFCKAHVIIHNAAETSYLKTYSSLRASNVESTKSLVDMVARYGSKKTPIHYISTVSVGNIVSFDLEAKGKDVSDFVFGPTTTAPFTPPAILSSSDINKTAHGYIASKWASETFLERLNKHVPDWPIIIHRPSSIAPEDWSKSINASPGLEFVDNIRTFTSILQAVPVFSAETLSLSGTFNIVSLEQVSRGVMEAVNSRIGFSGKGAQAVEFRHYIGDQELPMTDFRSWVLQGDDGTKIVEMDLLEWVKKAEEQGMHPAMVLLLQNLATARGCLTFPKLGAEQ